MERWVITAKEAVAECSYPEYTIEVVESATTKAVYLRARFLEADTLTGENQMQFTRRWSLSPEMSKSEIVATAFKCIMTSMEHRVREFFLYRNRAIYMPHYDVDTLHAVCEERDVREAVAK
jgi:hypothetical protein